MSKATNVRSRTNLLAAVLLRAMAVSFNTRPSLRKYLRGRDGWINFSVGFRTESDSVSQTLQFKDGRLSVRAGVRSPTTTLIFHDDDAVKEMLAATPNEVLLLLMRGRMRTSGNLTYLSLFNFYNSLLLRKRTAKALAKQRQERAGTPSPVSTNGSAPKPAPNFITAAPADKVKWLDEPNLARFSLDDFPRLKDFLDFHFTKKPEICAERPALLTQWFRDNGFETDRDGKPWNPVMRQALALRHLMESRKPIIRSGDLLGGTTTAKDVGVVIYPDSHGTMIWGELLSAADRMLNPYDVSEETVLTLHQDVFPYWASRNFREWVRDRHDEPLYQQLDGRFAVYFAWKTAALSHTIADYPKLFAVGARGIIEEIDREIAGADESKRITLQAMQQTLEGVIAYARNIAAQARAEADACTDPARAAELRAIAEACARVPEHPARTLFEAVQAMWLVWIGLHMENTNAGLSIGRLDVWLQPFFEADMAKLSDAGAREEYVRNAVELIGCFYMRLTDHLPLVPDIGNYLFGGSSSDQAITLGGLARDGSSAVCDMTYVFLKVTEMLKLRDPNVNARFSYKENSDAYLKRLCEVNLITTATPSMHCDETILASIEHLGYELEDRRDWSATGCVEPTVSGKHIGHTNCMMFNLVAALEMALYDGLHPLMDWKVGPSTGDPAAGAFPTFDDFFAAYTTQLRFLAEQAIEYNNVLGAAHADLRPTPLLSSLIDGTIRSGKDVTVGGAKYNTSGAACIGLADNVDSMMAIKHLVYDEKLIGFGELLDALRADFVGYENIHAMIDNKAPKFGSGDADALKMAQRIQSVTHGIFAEHRNFRGGIYTTGFWSMSNHVAFGSLTGALPSGRRAGKAFTPGLTPSPGASPNLLDNLRDVAMLDPLSNDNNMAFNVKYVPSASDPHERSVSNMAAYARGYFEMGGMQMQLNVVSSDTLRDAMAHPENYRDLLVRISGYNAYFVTLNRDMQIELIERAEYGA